MMAGAWRYTTNADCVRVWHWFARVGKPEIARTLPACTRAAALGLPLIAAPAAVPIPVRPVQPVGPGPFWAGEAPGGVGAFGPGLADVGEGYGPGVGPYGYAGGGAYGLGSLTVPGGPSGGGGAVGIGRDVLPQTGSAAGYALPTFTNIPAAGGSPAIMLPMAVAAVAEADTGDTPVPEPGSLAVLGAAVMAMVCVRRRLA